MIFSAVIIDDDLINIKLVSSLLKSYCPEVNVIATASNVSDGIKVVVNHKPQILFLDIQIHNKTGFDILKVIDDPSMQVILITAYEKYAMQAFKYMVVDYLLKPIDIEELIAAVNRSKSRILAFLKPESKVLPAINPNDFLGIRHRSSVQLLRLNDIIHLEAVGGYTEINTGLIKKSISSKSLKEIEEQLPLDKFFRVHHSFIVNSLHIAKYINAKVSSLIMSDGAEIPISNIKKKIVKDILKI